MVALKCKRCGSYDISAADGGFICEGCKAFYPANLMQELIEKEPEAAESEVKTDEVEAKVPESYEVEFSQPLTAVGNTQKLGNKRITPKVVLIVAAVLGVIFAAMIAWFALYPVICSAIADNYFESGDDIRAYQYYEYADDKDGMSRATHSLVDYYVSQGWYEPAYECYERINDENGMNKICYQWAEQCLNEGEKAQAAVLFGKAIGYLDAKERSFNLWDDIAVRTEGAESSWLSGKKAWLADEGVMVEDEIHSEGETCLEGWDDVISIVILDKDEIVGLKSDGTIVSTSDKYGGCTNVVGIYTYWLSDCLIVLYADGTTELLGHYGGIPESHSIFDTENVIFIYEDKIALKADGTVVASGDFSSYVQNWTDVVDIAATSDAVYGLKSDGTVLSADKQGNSVSKVSNWKNIQNIAGYSYDLVGLKTDGTLVSTDDDWKHIDKTGVEDIYDTSGGLIIVTRENGRLYVNW